MEKALEVIGNIEAAEELIDKLPEKISKSDEAAIKAADDAKAALAELNKPADTNSPATGDNSNLWLWFALLFVSGGTLFTLTVVDKKRKTVK